MPDEPTAATPDDTPDGESSVIRDLRKQLKTLQAERDELRGKARLRAFADAGVTDAGRKAMDRLYDGDLDPAAIKTFAVEHGIAVANGDEPTGAGGEHAEVPAEEQSRRDAAARVAATHAAGAAPPPADPRSDLQRRIEEAQEKGDIGTAVRLKSEQLLAMRNAAG